MRPATAADVRAYYRGPVAPTLQAMVMERDGEVLGIIGIARWRTFYEFFSEFRECARELLQDRQILRAILTVAAWLPHCRLPVYAVAEDTEPEATKLLERFGFTRVNGALYLWRS